VSEPSDRCGLSIANREELQVEVLEHDPFLELLGKPLA
jgi:hypothetical protein